MTIRQKFKQKQSAIVSAFLKPNTTMVQLAFSGAGTLKIKLEVDTDPPLVPAVAAAREGQRLV